MRRSLSVFFFNDTATTEIYTLSLHDALPICRQAAARQRHHQGYESADRGGDDHQPAHAGPRAHAGSARDEDAGGRSEEHTSELQSQSNLVCRLLLEKKKKNRTAAQTNILTSY